MSAKETINRITLEPAEGGYTHIIIPREGFSTKSMLTLLVIGLWLFMILIWTILLLQISPWWSLLSVPFWLLGFVTLRISMRMIMSSQEIIAGKDEITLIYTEGGLKSHISLKSSEIDSITWVEGGFKALSGISRKGIYPAVISHNEAYGFGQRCTKEEKKFLLETVKNLTNS